MDEEMMDGGPGISSKNKKILIAVVAIVAVVIVATVALPVVFLGYKFGLVDIPIFGNDKPVQMLIIRQPSIDMMADLDNQRSLVYYRVKDAADMDAAPKEQLAQFDIVLLDQHMGVTRYDKSVSRTLGEAIEDYVRTGGKLIVVMDSGIYRSGGIYGTNVAGDVIGWKATFGDIIPVECDMAANTLPTCTQPIATTGKIHRMDFDHKIMEGIEIAPADPSYGPLSMITYDVNPTGEQIAYIKHIATASNFPAIVERRLLIGKVIYFNYDPAMTPGIWQNTLEYLR